jgi:hypothetical protein
VWEATVRGQRLNFHLAGINNQNFIMRDEETGTWWQQVTGEALHGPLKGERLRAVAHDELSFATWKRERPNGRVLRPDERIEREGKYAPADWEEKVAKAPIVTPTGPADPLAPREIVIGVEAGGASKAYPLGALQKQSPIMDTVGGVPLLLVVGDDGQSVRAFEAAVEGDKVEFFVKPDARPLRMVDAATASEWDFEGQGVSGAHAGKRLRKLSILKDYWFDWKLYHPETAVYQLGAR